MIEYFLLCTDELYMDRQLRICEPSRVYIDGVPLAVQERDGKFVTELNQYVEHRTLRDAAHEAVALLDGECLQKRE